MPKKTQATDQLIDSLQERAKELNCLYAIEEILQRCRHVPKACRTTQRDARTFFQVIQRCVRWPRIRDFLFRRLAHRWHGWHRPDPRATPGDHCPTPQTTSRSRASQHWPAHCWNRGPVVPAAHSNDRRRRNKAVSASKKEIKKRRNTWFFLDRKSLRFKNRYI